MKQVENRGPYDELKFAKTDLSMNYD